MTGSLPSVPSRSALGHIDWASLIDSRDAHRINCVAGVVFFKHVFSESLIEPAAPSHGMERVLSGPDFTHPVQEFVTLQAQLKQWEQERAVRRVSLGSLERLINAARGGCEDTTLPLRHTQARQKLEEAEAKMNALTRRMEMLLHYFREGKPSDK